MPSPKRLAALAAAAIFAAAPALADPAPPNNPLLNTPPTSPVLAVGRNPTSTSAAIVLVTPNGQQVPIGNLNTSSGTFTPAGVAALQAAVGDALSKSAGLPPGYVDLTAQASGVLPAANLPLDLLFNSTPLTGSPTLTGPSPQILFSRTGTNGCATFVGATPTEIGISSCENLPFVVRQGPTYRPQLYVDPAYGLVGIGTTTPQAKLDVYGQNIIIEQSFTPSSSKMPCNFGTFGFDSNNLWVCSSTNQWSYVQLNKGL